MGLQAGQHMREREGMGAPVHPLVCRKGSLLIHKCPIGEVSRGMETLCFCDHR